MNDEEDPRDVESILPQLPEALFTECEGCLCELTTRGEQLRGLCSDCTQLADPSWEPAELDFS